MNTNLQLNPFRPGVVLDNNSKSAPGFFLVGVLIDAVLTGIKTSPHIPHPTHTQVNLAQEFYRRKHFYYASYVSIFCSCHSSLECCILCPIPSLILMLMEYKMNHMISKLYTKLGKKRSTSRTKTILEVEIQEIDDRFGDVPM